MRTYETTCYSRANKFIVCFQIVTLWLFSTEAVVDQTYENIKVIEFKDKLQAEENLFHHGKFVCHTSGFNLFTLIITVEGRVSADIHILRGTVHGNVGKKVINIVVRAANSTNIIIKNVVEQVVISCREDKTVFVRVVNINDLGHLRLKFVL